MGKFVPLPSQGEGWAVLFPSLAALFSKTVLKQSRRHLSDREAAAAQAPKQATPATNRHRENFSKSTLALVLTGVGLGFNSDYIANTFLWDNWLIASLDENHRTSRAIKTLRKAVLTLREITLLLTLGVNHRSSYSSFNRALKLVGKHEKSWTL